VLHVTPCLLSPEREEVETVAQEASSSKSDSSSSEHGTNSTGHKSGSDIGEEPLKMTLGAGVNGFLILSSVVADGDDAVEEVKVFGNSDNISGNEIDGPSRFIKHNTASRSMMIIARLFLFYSTC